MKSLLAAFLCVFVTITASAQTLKWSFEGEGAFAWGTDGHGALAVLNRTPGGSELGIVNWIDGSGRPLLTNVIVDLGENLASYALRIVRFTRNELAVQVEASYEYAPGTNFVRRFKRNGSFTDTVLPVGEFMDAVASSLSDDRGWFTREVVPGRGYMFRRYFN